MWARYKGERLEVQTCCGQAPGTNNAERRGGDSSQILYRSPPHKLKCLVRLNHVLRRPVHWASD